MQTYLRYVPTARQEESWDQEQTGAREPLTFWPKEKICLLVDMIKFKSKSIPLPHAYIEFQKWALPYALQVCKWKWQYDNSSIVQLMTQPKLQLDLPVKLTLAHFLHPHALTHQEAQKQQSSASERVAMRLKAMVPEEGPTYTSQFVADFLLIKLNNWIAFSAFPSAAFLPALAAYYNRILPHNAACCLKYSRNDGELVAQILLESQASECVQEDELDELLEGSALVGATAAEALRQGQWVKNESYFVVVLGLVGLHGRTHPYIPIVHKEKNHLGQIEFARKVDSLIHLNPKVHKVSLEIIQDAYSLRCTPQVHGVSLECLSKIEAAFEGLVNRPQTRQVVVGGRRMRNLALRASQAMLLDELMMGLNELGHMSFLRSQRMLNRHLGKNNISKNQHFEYLRILLKKYSYFVAENKVLAIPGSIDTVLMQDYKHDLYVHEGTAHARLTALFKNLKYLCKLELMAALQVVEDMYVDQQHSLFLNQEMESAFQELSALRNEDSLQYGKAIEKWLKI